ncbi:MAG: hypothetical protein RL248_1609 [Pseudomonadota bacterium]|jgi:pilus assembly protein CpaB
MNRKFLLLFSLLIVAIGVAGILINIEDDKNKPYDFVEPKKANEVDIVLAQSIRDLASGTLLTKNGHVFNPVIIR